MIISWADLDHAPQAPKPAARGSRLCRLSGNHVSVGGARGCCDVSELIAAMCRYRFDEPAMEYAVDSLSRDFFGVAEDVESQSANIDRRSYPGLTPPLIGRVREVAVLVVRPCNNV